MNLQDIDNYTQDELENILDKASNAYYNTNKITMTDEDFDFVKEYLLSKYLLVHQLQILLAFCFYLCLFHGR